MRAFTITEQATTHAVRAVYYPTAEGLKLARVQVCPVRAYKESGWELIGDLAAEPAADREASDPIKNRNRAIRRARQSAFDAIMSSEGLDAFVTLTYSPEEVGDKTSYEECYKRLRAWLSNGVQRRGLAYVGVPEYTKRGDVHFHMLANSSALKLVEAVSASTNRKIKRNGKQVYNVADWSAGFSTALLIDNHAEESAKTACACYMWKYMSKSSEKIGGRYFLKGGNLGAPVYVLGDTAEEFFTGEPCREYVRETPLGTYREYGFVAPSRPPRGSASAAGNLTDSGE